jgi:hypothetical protein
MNTQFLFPLALGMASAIFVYCFTDRKKFGAPLSIVVGLIVGWVLLTILPSFTTWSGIP